MLSLTRAEALTQARLEFQRYVERLLMEDRLPRDYVVELGRHWDKRLASLARLGSDLLISPEVVSSMTVLARAVRDPDRSEDAAVRWLDVFPDRVADLFPPSDVTFRLIDEAEQRETDETVQTGAMASAA
jgi:hypothetical protein